MDNGGGALLRDSGRRFLFVSALLLGGCGSSDNLRIAKEATTHVHTQMDSEQFTQIYSEADDALRAATKQQDFLDFISAVHRKLGKVQNATQTSFFVNFSTSGTRVRLNYQTKFDAGEAQEEFIWKIKGGQAALVGYHISSNALITK
jgi:major membrane immunogen (membrane-anchored lipoprotein)